MINPDATPTQIVDTRNPSSKKQPDRPLRLVIVNGMLRTVEDTGESGETGESGTTVSLSEKARLKETVSSQTAADLFVAFLEKPLGKDCPTYDLVLSNERSVWRRNELESDKTLWDAIESEGVENVISQNRLEELKKVKEKLISLERVVDYEWTPSPRKQILEIWNTALTTDNLDEIAQKYIPQEVLALISQRINRLWLLDRKSDEDYELCSLLIRYGLSGYTTTSVAIYHRLIKAALCEHYLIAKEVPMEVFNEYDNLVRQFTSNIDTLGIPATKAEEIFQELDKTQVKFIDELRMEGCSGKGNMAIEVSFSYHPPFQHGLKGAASTIFHERGHEVIRLIWNSHAVEKQLDIDASPTYNEVFVSALTSFAHSPDLSEIPDDDYSEGVRHLKTLLERISITNDGHTNGFKILLKQLIGDRENNPGIASLYSMIGNIYNQYCSTKYGQTFDQEMLLYSDAAFATSLKDEGVRQKLYAARGISNDESAMYERVAVKVGGNQLKIQPRDVFYRI